MAVKLVLVLAVGACSSTPKPVPQPAGGVDTTACEPGRCLPDISKVVQEHRDEARACYDAMATTKPGVKGRLIINFKIDANGDVVDTSQGMQEDQIQDEGLVTCLTAVIQKLHFPKSAAGKSTRAYHQFEFAPR